MIIFFRDFFPHYLPFFLKHGSQFTSYPVNFSMVWFLRYRTCPDQVRNIFSFKLKHMKSPEALNDLIEINKDRVVGYEKAAAQADDVDLKSIFNSNAAESKKFADE